MARGLHIVLSTGVQMYGLRWELVAASLPRRTPKMCKNRWENHVHIGLNKGAFSEVEDQVIVDMVGAGVTKWSVIARKLENRVGKQCRERWFNHLDPQLKKTPWTAEEDEQLITSQAKIGNSWTRISLEIPGRRCLDSSESISCLYSCLF